MNHVNILGQAESVYSMLRRLPITEKGLSWERTLDPPNIRTVL
jgi:hypothetical protein